jgi:hypothetical protein
VSVYDENGVPVVYRGPDQRIGLSAPLDHDPDEILIGESVVIHCKRLRDTAEEAPVTFSIGAENTPDWVASTHDGLAQALADYYSCQVRDIAEVF